MPSVVRAGDKSSGHHCYPPQDAECHPYGSNVFVNSRSAHKVGDPWGSHCCPNAGCHTGVLRELDLTAHDWKFISVFINNKPITLVGMRTGCGAVAMIGSPNVFAERR